MGDFENIWLVNFESKSGNSPCVYGNYIFLMVYNCFLQNIKKITLKLTGVLNYGKIRHIS